MAMVVGTFLSIDKNNKYRQPKLRTLVQESFLPIISEDIVTTVDEDELSNETLSTGAAVVDSGVDVVDIRLHPNSQPERKKHHLYLHVGPQKTGSSTLQSLWDRTRPALANDGYVHRHMTPERGDFDCDVSLDGDFYNCVASQQLKALIYAAKMEGKNLLLTDENLDRRFAQTLRDAIDDNDWQVTVVVVYRRIHEWLASWYNQIHKTTNLDVNGNILLDEDGIPTRQPNFYWPDQGGVRIPNFSSWYYDYTRSWDSLSDLVDQHRSIDFYNAYNALFDNVVVYNFHQDGDLATNFMCDVVQSTPTVCKRLRNHAIEGTKMNPSINLKYDILAVYAYDEGLLANDSNMLLSRTEVVDAISKFVAESGKILPWKCDDGLLNQVRDWLIGSERKVYEDIWNPNMEADLYDVYDSYLQSGELCDLDFDVLFADDDWIRFFESLREGSIIARNDPVMKEPTISIQNSGN